MAERQHQFEQDAQERRKNFNPVEENFTYEQAKLESSRCLNCKNPRCVEGCPVNINIPAFIKKVKEDDIKGAGDIIRESSLLPSVCGRVCPQERQCEGKCVLGIKGEPVSIGALERYVGDQTEMENTEIKENGKKVAIIGSGCTGITAAADLRRLGYKITVFEALHKLGGVLRYGIPPFRLPRTVLDKEIDNLKNIGVEFKTNVVAGKSITVKQLKEEGYEAVLIGSGAGFPKMLGIEGENLNGVYSANEFLTRVNLMGANREETATPIRTGKRAAIIGGGNVAMDAARVAVRVGYEEVYVIYRRTEAELPARKAEVRHAKEEGVIFNLLRNPVKIEGENGEVKSMVLDVMELGEPDESGRRRPVSTGKTENMDIDTIIVALGTSPNPIIQRSMETDSMNLETDRKGYIVIDAQTGKTSIEGVFAGGDVAPSGESTAINAMGAGKRAAKAIHEYLSSK